MSTAVDISNCEPCCKGSTIPPDSDILCLADGCRISCGYNKSMQQYVRAYRLGIACSKHILRLKICEAFFELLRGIYGASFLHPDVHKPLCTCCCCLICSAFNNRHCCSCSDVLYRACRLQGQAERLLHLLPHLQLNHRHYCRFYDVYCIASRHALAAGSVHVKQTALCTCSFICECNQQQALLLLS